MDTQPLPWIVAHRGASAHAPENSLAACDLAVKFGADFLEVDVRATKDHILVLHHNRGIRVGTKRYWIDKHSFLEIKRLKPTIITLEEVIKRYGNKVGLDLDIKQAALEELIVRLLKRYRIKKPIMVISNNFAILWRFKELYPTCTTTFLLYFDDRHDILYSLFGRVLYKTLPKILKYFAPYITVWRVRGRLIDAVTFDPPSMVNKLIVEELHTRGTMVFAAPVNSEREVIRMLTLGVDAMKTDRPDMVKRVLAGKITADRHILPVRLLRRLGGKVKRVLTREVFAS